MDEMRHEMTVKYLPSPFDPRETAQSARWADECMELIRYGTARKGFEAYGDMARLSDGTHVSMVRPLA